MLSEYSVIPGPDSVELVARSYTKDKRRTSFKTEFGSPKNKKLAFCGIGLKNSFGGGIPEDNRL